MTAIPRQHIHLLELDHSTKILCSHHSDWRVLRLFGNTIWIQHDPVFSKASIHEDV